MKKEKSGAQSVSLFAYFKQAFQPIPVKTDYSAGKEVA